MKVLELVKVQKIGVEVLEIVGRNGFEMFS